MNQKQKIIIFLSSISLGLMFIPFLKKDSSTKKNNDQCLINNKNNRQLPKKKKKAESSLIFGKKIQIIGIIIFVLIVIKFILDFIIKFFIVPAYLAERYCTIQFSKDHIQILFVPKKQAPDYRVADQLYRQEIAEMQLPHVPQDMQKIYNDLKDQKHTEYLKSIGKLFINFFNVIDGHLLNAVCKYQQQIKEIQNRSATIMTITKNLKEIFKNLLNPRFFKKDHQILQFPTVWGALSDQNKITTFDRSCIHFFKDTITQRKLTYYEVNNFQEVFLFQYSHAFYDLFLEVSKALYIFFEDQQNAEYTKKYKPNYLNVINNIDNYFTKSSSAFLLK